jgi:hypothetical protein
MMKRAALPWGLQGNLPLLDMPSLELPQQEELALALMELLVQVSRQLPSSSQSLAKEDPDGHEVDS